MVHPAPLKRTAPQPNKVNILISGRSPGDEAKVMDLTIIQKRYKTAEISKMKESITLKHVILKGSNFKTSESSHSNANKVIL